MERSPTWFEIWDRRRLATPYVLIVLLASNGSPGVQVIDPAHGHRVVFSAADYKAVRLWLLEDEYERVGDRINR